MSVFYGKDKSTEYIFQNDMIRQMLSNGWLLGNPKHYNRKLALYSEDVLGFIQDTQHEQWQKYCKLYPNNPEQRLVAKVKANKEEAITG